MRLSSWGASAARRRCFPVDGSRAGKGLWKLENMHLSQQRLLNHWLVAPQETPSHAHLERHVPSEARLSAGREWTGGCRRYTPWQMEPTFSSPQAVKRLSASPSGLKKLLLSALQRWGLLWLSHPGLVQPGLAPRYLYSFILA